jgi:phenylacetate-CoA ligase
MISPVTKWAAEKTGLYENLNPVALKEWQQNKLNDVIEYCRTKTRFYSNKLGASTELINLPFTYPSDLANDPPAFLAIPQNKIARVSTHANSGTTNQQKRVFFSDADLERTKVFFAVGMSGIVHENENAAILISSETENSLGSLLKESLENIGVKSKIAGTVKSVDDVLEISRGTDCLVGMPSEIYYLSKIAPDIRPKSILLAGDIASKVLIKGIQNIWGCQVFTHYGHSGFGFGCAVDCIYHDGLHLRDADNIFEIIDPMTNEPANFGEIGEITITTLSNEAMPLIRYRTGNLARMLITPCKCGSLLHRLRNIEGRISDDIFLPGEVKINILELEELLYSTAEIRGFNAAFYKKENTLKLTVDAANKIDFDFLFNKLPKELKIGLNYGNAYPFMMHQKRRIQII